MTVDKKKPNMVGQEVTKLDDEQLKDVAGGKRDDDANYDDPPPVKIMCGCGRDCAVLKP